MKDEALRQAREALKGYRRETNEQVIALIDKALAQEKALQALHNENERLGLYKDAYGQPEPEPVVRIVGKAKDEPVLGWSQHWSDFPVGTEFYTSPPKREWQGLTDEEITELSRHELWIKNFIKQIEEKLRIKNT